MKTDKPRFRVRASIMGWKFNKVETGERFGTILYNGSKTPLCTKYLNNNPQLK